MACVYALQIRPTPDAMAVWKKKRKERELIAAIVSQVPSYAS